ncbi:MAG: hypothetical protein CL521_05130 [Actinobacteria bacterium]|nr:hypothetical protein [Actinomycetota bacterium]|tara:strand:+ start:106 stop:765 length:660 start_codon:yes stop_codon:yes gene_type:complete
MLSDPRIYRDFRYTEREFQKLKTKELGLEVSKKRLASILYNIQEVIVKEKKELTQLKQELYLLDAEADAEANAPQDLDDQYYQESELFFGEDDDANARFDKSATGLARQVRKAYQEKLMAYKTLSKEKEEEYQEFLVEYRSTYQKLEYLRYQNRNYERILDTTIFDGLRSDTSRAQSPVSIFEMAPQRPEIDEKLKQILARRKKFLKKAASRKIPVERR